MNFIGGYTGISPSVRQCVHPCIFVMVDVQNTSNFVLPAPPTVLMRVFLKIPKNACHVLKL